MYNCLPDTDPSRRLSATSTATRADKGAWSTSCSACHSPPLILRPKDAAMHPYERWTIRRYLANALKSSRFARPPSADWDIVTWIGDHRRLLDLPELASGALSSRRRLATEASVQLATWKAWRVAAISMGREPAPKPSPLQKRLDWLARACLLTHGQSRVLGLLARATQTPQVGNLVDAVNGRFGIRLNSADSSDLPPAPSRSRSTPSSRVVRAIMRLLGSRRRARIESAPYPPGRCNGRLGVEYEIGRRPLCGFRRPQLGLLAVSQSGPSVGPNW
jgi:hypothetical protein